MEKKTRYDLIIPAAIFLILTVLVPIAGAVIESDLPIPEILAKNVQFTGYTSKLSDEGFGLDEFISTMTAPDKTSVTITYAGPGERQAVITAEMTGDVVTKISMKKEEEPVWPLLLVLLIIIIGLIAGYYLYTRYHHLTPAVPIEVPDVRKSPEEEAEEILILAEKAREEGDLKTAYALAGRALRVFISLTYGCGTEETNMEIIHLYKNTGEKTDTVSNILQTCSLVEFAKKEGDTDEFSAIVSVIRGLI
ncbi:MAG: hypothetical protein JXA44_01265 [Methanospirillaceae archaeon]|nr:hypothetical protein [Methanospirillaceae archaeon]